MKRFSLKIIGSLFIITLLAVLAYLGTLHSPFIYDDEHAIVENPYIKGLKSFREFVGFGNFFNRPMVLLSFAVNYELGGLNVTGYHLLNLLLHVFVGITLFFLTAELLFLEAPERRLRLKNLPLLISVTHVFNPMAVESVTYISSRSSLLAALFFLLSFYYYLCFVGRQDKKSLESFFSLFPIAGFFLLGCAS